MLWISKSGDLKDPENAAFQTTIEFYTIMMLNPRQIAEHVRKDLMVEIWLFGIDQKELGIQTVEEEKKVREYVR